MPNFPVEEKVPEKLPQRNFVSEHNTCSPHNDQESSSSTKPSITSASEVVTQHVCNAQGDSELSDIKKNKNSMSSAPLLLRTSNFDKNIPEAYQSESEYHKQSKFCVIV